MAVQGKLVGLIRRYHPSRPPATGEERNRSTMNTRSPRPWRGGFHERVQAFEPALQRHRLGHVVEVDLLQPHHLDVAVEQRIAPPTFTRGVSHMPHAGGDLARADPFRSGLANIIAGRSPRSRAGARAGPAPRRSANPPPCR